MSATTRARTRTARSQPLEGRQYAAIVGQIASYFTTLLFIQALAGVPPEARFTDLPTLIIALVVEYLVAKGKERVLDGDLWDKLGIVCIGFDAFLNGGGVWGGITQIDQSASWNMLSSGLDVGSKVSPLAAMIISLAIGVALSVAPHLLWAQKKK